MENEISTAPPQPPGRSFRLPSDYYSAPLSEVRPLVPRWVPLGCGGAAALFLFLLFVGSALLQPAHFAMMVDFVIGQSLGEVRRMYAPEITAAQKETFEATVKSMREQLRNERIGVNDVQAFLQAMQKAVGDSKVTAPELDGMTAAAERAASRSRPAAR